MKSKSQVNPESYTFFAVCPGGLDEILKKEVEGLPATVTATYPGGVEFTGPLELTYLSNLKLRTASRVLFQIKTFKQIFKPEEFTRAIESINWSDHFSNENTFAIYLTVSETKPRRIPVNQQFWALKAKDSIVDQFRNKTGSRPNIDRDNPDITLRFHLHDQILKVYLDLSGISLHERGYRTQTLEAPIKENLAAGLLLLMGWQFYCKEGFVFFDPFCGSGTLLIEAALIATKTAPGLFRTQFGFMSWIKHDPDLFERIRDEVLSEQVLDPKNLPMMVGADENKEAIQITKENLIRAGMEPFVSLKINSFQDTTAFSPKGIIVTNPPYGVRLDESARLKELYQKIGSTLKHHYTNWSAGVITSDLNLLNSIGLKPSKKWALHNGGLESQYSIFRMY